VLLCDGVESEIVSIFFFFFRLLSVGSGRFFLFMDD
jgi:hypothetical protein